MKVLRSRQKSNHLPALLLFTLFAVCVLLVLLTSADTYQRISARDQQSYDCRTAVQYLSTRVRQSDCQGSLSVVRFGEQDALLFTETIDGRVYETRVYCHDGYLRELFGEAGADFAPEHGEKVLAAQTLQLRKDGCRLDLTLTPAAGEAQLLQLYLRSEAEVVS